MNIKIFSVYDSKVGSYRYPFFMQSTGQALRAFIDLSNDGKSEVFKYPSDFTLFEHGHFDDETGELVKLPAPLSHGVAITFKNSSEGGK